MGAQEGLEMDGIIKLHCVDAYDRIKHIIKLHVCIQDLTLKNFIISKHG